MYCLDTYALWEIQFQNPHYAFLLDETFVITNWTLAEFYKTLLREYDKKTARYWVEKFKNYIKEVPITTLLEAIDYQHEHKKENLSLFDCVGYVYSISTGLRFVTGDRGFEHKFAALFIPK